MASLRAAILPVVERLFGDMNAIFAARGVASSLDRSSARIADPDADHSIVARPGARVGPICSESVKVSRKRHVVQPFSLEITSR
jgi:hypothetical protein